jgi:ribose transport system permease protein
VFSVWEPSEFPTTQTVHAILAQYAVTGLVAVSVVAPLACGVFDLTIGANIGLSGMTYALLSSHTGIPVVGCILLALLTGVVLGLINVLVVVVVGIDSFIGTLATGAIFTALTTAVSGGKFVVLRAGSGWTSFATGTWLTISLPAFYLLAIAIVVGLWLERTAAGRYMYATGFDPETARLTGLPIARLRTVSLLSSGLIAAFAGVVLVAQVGSADPNAGAAYLIPAFSAAFLGATQFRSGRFNTWGTLVAVFLLATGDYGMIEVGGPTWATSVFEGAVLLIAIGFVAKGGMLRRWRRKSKAVGAASGEAALSGPALSEPASGEPAPGEPVPAAPAPSATARIQDDRF